MNIGKAIRGVRKQKGLNQADFAHLVHITHNHLSSIERGQYMPSWGLIESVSRVAMSPIYIWGLLGAEKGDI